MIRWFTNVAAPYRIPLWERIEEQHPLRVHLLETSASLDREGRRPDDWKAPQGSRYTWVPNVTIRRGERSFYVARSAPVVPRGTSAVLIGAWESPVYWQVLLEAKVRRIRTVGFYESTLQSNRHRSGPVAAARSRFYRSLDAVVVPGLSARRALESFGVESSRIHQGFNAVDVTAFHSAARSRPEPHGPGHRFVFVGQLIQRKNPLLLLRAFAKSRLSDDTLCYVGTGEQMQVLRNEAVGLGLAEVVEFEGALSNQALARRLHHFDTLVLPSEEEVWGLVVNEALAAGLGVVVSENAGVAASVAEMTRVFVTSPTETGIEDALVKARKAGVGLIETPEILAHTPDRFADVFTRALVPSGGMSS
ncbi:glycosyltransferase family 4 protein [Curtobacterium sp. VKM Ac-2865]|uniref:glycosyltransferase family 4 protein n=1 Tax=Curtobacterium sp. VKM Ac-2865 TaxID=2783817 RepID=UPI00188A3788|nr:glycosyltransferase family 4 protein [Curtobacterium sp. VKM Ac-2865]MBF4582936.1 glycosyltransferase family 4 protein [Curtobacterium sp. VKM Ac-2865]